MNYGSNGTATWGLAGLIFCFGATFVFFGSYKYKDQIVISSDLADEKLDIPINGPNTCQRFGLTLIAAGVGLGSVASFLP